MPAAKVKSKGTALLMEISSVYTAFTGLKQLSVTGIQSETWEYKVLDGAAAIAHSQTGYVQVATINFDLFRDPDDAVHQAFLAKCYAPADNNFKVTYADATPLSEIYVGVGFGMDTTAAPSDGLSSSCTIQTSGAPT
jgi:hypothetical protein